MTCDFVYSEHWGLGQEGEGDLFRDKSHLHIAFIKDLRGPLGLSIQRLLSSSSCLGNVPS